MTDSSATVVASAGNDAAQAADDEAAKAAKAKILEGVDFIETEEDAEAVESAVVKIQSTFRGKKIRSKLNKQAPAQAANTEQADGQSAAAASTKKEEAELGEKTTTNNSKDEEELKKGVATMQELLANLAEDEVERAATKIQAGFKGYKTRKELEGKFATGSSSPSGGQQMASQQQQQKQQASMADKS